MRTNQAWVLPEWAETPPPNVGAFSTTRRGGVSHAPYASLNLAQHVGDEPARVVANRSRVLEAAALQSEPLWLEQVHGSEVIVHEGAQGLQAPRADAAVTFEPGRVCVVMTADCLPVVFTDRAGTRVGVAHAGWRGLASGVLEATIDALQAPPSEILAWLGPAIAQPAFEVGIEVRDAFVSRNATHASAFAPNPRGRFQADLYLLARQALERAGVSSIGGGGRCTFDESAEFFSFRRDGGRTGRMATLAWLTR